VAENVKGALKNDPGQVHRYRLMVIGLNPSDLNPTKVGGIEQETGKAELPDRTAISDGVPKAGELTVTIPAHHGIELGAVEAWYNDTRAKAPSKYKKSGTLLVFNGARQIVRTVKLTGLWPNKRTEPDYEMSAEGDMAEVEWTFSFDEASAS